MGSERTEPDGRAGIAAVVVNYRSAGETLEAVGAFLASRYRGPLAALVVENQSGGGDRELLEKGLPAGARLIVSDRNRGFAGGINLALPAAAADLVLVLNPDTRLHPDAVQTMADLLAARPRAAAVGPLLLDGRGGAESSGRRRLTPWRIVASRLGWARLPAALPEPPAPHRADWLVGACMLIRRRALDEVGGFDEGYFLYFEETDLCDRFLSSGWEVWVHPGAACLHAHAPSAERSGEALLGREILSHFLASRRRYLRRRHGVMAALLAEAGLVLLYAAALARNALRAGPRAAARRRECRMLLGAYLQGGRGRSGREAAV